jgi:isocitrate/isopropylmalate dehydrogenase
MLLTAKMMLDWLGEADMGKKLHDAIAAVLKEGSAKTYDMGGSAGTLDAARAVIERI